jgi:DNA invertase Pin-like site-specific DNA recombinase
MSKNQGSKNFKSKLVDSEVIDIITSDLSQRALAEKYSISQSLVSRIKRRKLWQHIVISEQSLL